eukprot:1609051-Pleurochrysis_carterae.AAC.1
MSSRDRRSRRRNGAASAGARQRHDGDHARGPAACRRVSRARRPAQPTCRPALLRRSEPHPRCDIARILGHFSHDYGYPRHRRHGGAVAAGERIALSRLHGEGADGSGGTDVRGPAP